MEDKDNINLSGFDKEAKQGCFIFIVIIIIIIVFFFKMCSKGDGNSSSNVPYSDTTEVKLGSNEWKEQLISNAKSDSETIAKTNYSDIANGTNREMSDAISFLENGCPWGSRVASEDSFFINDKRISKAVQFIESKSKNIKNSIMPKYRKRFAKNLASEWWKDDLYVTASGTGNKILNVTGAIFASNSYIQSYYELLNMDAKNFGFSQIRFRWYKGADDYTYYTLK